jgi:two-component sensor histidine kinase
LLFRREREMKELHHRVANSLQLASSFLIFQQKQFDDQRLQDALQAAAIRLGAVGKLHRHLYAHSENSEVDLKQFLEELCPEIAQSTGLGCQVVAEPITVSGDMAQQLAIVINEFALNAAKHGYDGQPGGRVKIECHREADQLRLVVADGGKGLGDDFDPNNGKGLGMSIVGAIVQQLNGNLTAEDDHGARFVLVAPLF